MPIFIYHRTDTFSPFFVVEKQERLSFQSEIFDNKNEDYNDICLFEGQHGETNAGESTK